MSAASPDRPPVNGTIALLLFDLDGTLADTSAEIADALNDTLRRLLLPEVAEEQVRGWIGGGTRELLMRALVAADRAEWLDAAWAGFARDYERRCGTRSRLYPGAAALLRRARAAGLRLALLTNKEERFARRILQRHALAPLFDLVIAGDTLARAKPHPDEVWLALQRLGLAPAQALLVGDSLTDLRTARAAGIAVWLVRHGYPGGLAECGEAPDGWIAHFDEFRQPTTPAAARRAPPLRSARPSTPAGSGRRSRAGSGRA